MIIAATGHRPNKIKSYNQEAYPGTFSYERLVDLSFQIIKSKKPTHVISGMSLGFDMAIAQAAIDADVPFIAAVPFEGQESLWPQKTQDYYQALLDKASEIEFISEPGYEKIKMQKRNEWMVNHSDLLVALWDGSKGGTSNCISYAENKKLPIINYWDIWENHKEELKFNSTENSIINYYGIKFPSLENFIQAIKYKDERIRRHIATINPNEVRKNTYGQLREDLDYVFYDAVLYGIREKYKQNTELKKKLLLSEPRKIHHWNLPNCFDEVLDVNIETLEGQNLIGNGLEVVRNELLKDGGNNSF